METELFRELGFTDREVKVYLALLDLGSTTVGPITSKTKLQAAKVYETLEKLKEKGLVSFIVVSKTKYFQASDPQEILHLLDDRKRRFKEILEELRLKQKDHAPKQVAVVHEGYKAFKALFNRIADELNKEDSYFAFAFKEEYFAQTVSLFLKNFHRTLEEKKNIKIKFTKNDTPLGVIIIKGKVINLIWGDRPTAIEITSQQIHEQYKKFFLEL